MVTESLLRTLYLEYHAIPEPDLFFSRAKELFPSLNCGIASVYLKHCFGAGQIVQGSYAGLGHTFLVLDDVIVDITADQFGGPPVYVGPLISPWSPPESQSPWQICSLCPC